MSEKTINWFKDSLQIPTRGKGLYHFTEVVHRKIQGWDIQEGMCYLFIQHTSASLVMSESYDPTAKMDLETFMERLVPDGAAWHQHTLEGEDDSPSHIRAMLTQVSLTIPIDNGQLNLGTWQGIYLFEHRAQAHRRQVLLRCLKIG